jgi:hypothetical protein
METIDLADGFDLKRIAKGWENPSAEHSVQIRAIFFFAPTRASSPDLLDY